MIPDVPCTAYWRLPDRRLEPPVLMFGPGVEVYPVEVPRLV